MRYSRAILVVAVIWALTGISSQAFSGQVGAQRIDITLFPGTSTELSVPVDDFADIKRVKHPVQLKTLARQTSY